MNDFEVLAMQLLDLPDELLASVTRQIYCHVSLCRFLQCCSKTLATAAQRDELYIEPILRPGWSSSDHVSMLVPTAWSARFVGLTSLTVSALSLSGTARLIVHLRSWPLLEELAICVAAEQYRVDDEGDAEEGADMLECMNDLAKALRTGFVRLPALRHLSVSDWWSEQRYSGPDANILAALTPCAQLWWMAERARHVRCKHLSRWRELAETADLHWQYGGYTILSWLSSQLPFTRHSQRGYRAVYKVLVEHGASEKKMKFPPHYWKGPPEAPHAIYDRIMADERVDSIRQESSAYDSESTSSSDDESSDDSDADETEFVNPG